MQRPHGPMRRCLVCRKSGPKRELLRFAMNEGGVRWDRGHTLQGRGAYVHATAQCWSRMCQPGMWEHALRLSKGSLPVESLRAAAKEAGEALQFALDEQPRGKVRL